MFELIKDMIINLYHSEQPYVLLLNVLVFVALIVFVLSLTKYWSDHNVMQKFIAKVRADAKEQERLREEEYRKQFEMNGRFESKDKMLKLNQKLIDSGLKDKFPELQPETFLLSCTLGVGLVVITIALLNFPPIGTLATGFLLVLIIVFALESLISANTARIEAETIKFVNLLKNNSHMGGSIGEILGRTIPYISGPLKISVERCFYEIRTTGNVSGALQNLTDRTNYKKLKEIFDALRVCSTHNEDYESVINETNISVEQYIAFRKETREIKQNNLIEMIVMGVIGVLIIYMMKGMLPDIDVWYYVFKTNIGLASVTGMAIILLIGIYRAVRNEE